MDAMKQLKIAKNGYILMSVLFMILGACLIIWPDCSMAVFCTAVGIMLIVYGLIKILGYFSRDVYCLAFQFDFAFGVLLAAVGVIIIVRRNVVVNLIFGIFGILILADALFKIQMSVDAKKFGLNLFLIQMKFMYILIEIFRNNIGSNIIQVNKKRIPLY